MSLTLADGLAIGGGLFVIVCLIVAGWLSSIEKRRHRPIDEHTETHYQRHNGANGSSFR